MALRLMFTKVVDRYDLLNHIITLGLDVFWRKMAARQCKYDGVMIDLCCGTGELLLQLSKFATSKTLLIGLDFSEAMLREAKEKVDDRLTKKHSKKDDAQKIDFILADAGKLPFRNSYINCICMSFSLRNLIFKNRLAESYLREIFRVLNIKGRFVTVESSQPRAYPLRNFFHLYLKKIVPSIGGLVSGYKPAYHYLGISAANFPSAQQVKEMLEKIGFQKVSFTHVIFGIVAIHLSIK